MHILRTKCKTPKEFDNCASTLKEVLSKLKGMEFPEAVKYLMEVGDYEIKDVTDRPDDLDSLSYRIFQRYKNGETKRTNKRIVVAICVAMRLPFVLSNALVETAGFCFSNSKEDAMLLTILHNCNGMSFEEINRILKELSYEPLTHKND